MEWLFWKNTNIKNGRREIAVVQIRTKLYLKIPVIPSPETEPELKIMAPSAYCCQFYYIQGHDSTVKMTELGWSDNISIDSLVIIVCNGRMLFLGIMGRFFTQCMCI